MITLFIKKVSTRKNFFLLGCFAVMILLFFCTRIYNLLTLPIFTDEALYIRWAQIAKQDANWRFISLVDGKQPSVIWFMIVTLKIFHDPLFAGRMVSVFTGFFAMIGMIVLGRELFKNIWVGVLSGFLYLLFPMALVYDRMALYDTTVTMFAIWVLYFQVLLVRRIRLDIAFILGMVMGGAVLTKSSGFLAIDLIVFSLLLFDWKQKNWKRRLGIWAVYASIASGFAYVYYQILRLSPFFHVIAEKNKIFVYPFSEWIKHPLTYFIGNSQAILNWVMLYLTLPIIIFIAISFGIDSYGKKSQKKQYYFGEKLFLIMWFVFPGTALGLFGNNIYPRFIFFMITPLLILTAYSLYIIFLRFGKRIFVASLIIAILWFLYADYFIIQDFAHAPIAKSDLGQYNNDWPAGGGVKESIALFQKEAEDKKIFVATEGTFGLLPQAYEMYLVDNKNITLKGIWPINNAIPEDILKKSKLMPTYFVFYQECHDCEDKGLAPISWKKNLEIVFQFQKPAPDAVFTVYRVKP